MDWITIEITGNAISFPSEFVITGDAKNNNDFFTATQKYLSTYAQTVNMNELMTKDEKTFLKGIEKVQADVNKNIEENVKKFSPDNGLVEWKKNDLASTLLTILNQYELSFRLTLVNADVSDIEMLKRKFRFDVAHRGDKHCFRVMFPSSVNMD